MGLDPLQIFLQVIGGKSIALKWAGKPHEAFKSLPNSSKGDAGEEFLSKYAIELGYTVSKSGRLGDWDLEINGKKFEVKLASEDINGTFQFNHVRYDSKYEWLICLGVTPTDLVFGIWSKADVATGVAGTMVSMGKNQNSSFKLTKKASDLENINLLGQRLAAILPDKVEQVVVEE